MLPLPEPYLVVLPKQEFIPPYNQHFGVMNPKAVGGVALRDTTEPADKYVWDMYVVDGTEVFIGKDLSHELLFTVDNPITWLSFCFDINMNPTVTYVSGGKSYLYFFDTSLNDVNTIELADAYTPNLVLDETRQFNINNATILLAYLKQGKLMVRFQHERFQQEHELYTPKRNKMLWRIGKTVSERIGFYLR